MTHKPIQGIAVSFGCLPAFEGNSILWKTMHSSDTGLRETELNLTQKLDPWGLAFIALEGAVLAVKRGKHPLVLHSYYT